MTSSPLKPGKPLQRKTPEYTHTANGRTWRLYGCAKRGCDHVNPDYLSFAASDGTGYCLNHIPLGLRLRLWWRDRT